MIHKLKFFALTPLIVVVFFSLYIRFPSSSRYGSFNSGFNALKNPLEFYQLIDSGSDLTRSENKVVLENGNTLPNISSHFRKKFRSQQSNLDSGDSMDPGESAQSTQPTHKNEIQSQLVAEKREHYRKLAVDFMSETSLRWGEGEDENTECLSRTEQHRLWKDSGPKKSETLIEAMKEYEEFHRDCRLKESDIGNMNTAFLNQTVLPCRYLVWLAPYDGMGNRLLSLVSTYLYALLTKRVLVMDRRWKMEELLCDPFTESSIFLPKYVRTTKMISQARNIIEMSNMSAALRSEGKPYTPSYSTIAYVNHEADMRFFCETDLMTFDQSHVILLLSNMYYVPGFYFTSYRSEVERLFPDRRIFVHLARYLLNPTNKIWNSIKEFYEENLRDADRQVGMQVRLFYGSWEKVKSQILLTCALENKLLPEVVDGEDEEKPEFEKSMSQTKKNSVEYSTTVCLVASLIPQFYENLQQYYANKSTQHNVVVQVKRAGQESLQRSEVMEHNEQVIKEIWLLSFSDDIIASPGSTFGYIAAGLAGKTPLLLQDLSSGQIPPGEKACWVYESPEPCYHAPPMKVRCPLDNIEEFNPWKQLPFIRRCHDFPRGIQVRMENVVKS